MKQINNPLNMLNKKLIHLFHHQPKPLFSLTLAALAVVCSPTALALDLSGLKDNEVAVFVQNMDTGRTIAEHRADAAMNPASTMKLLTAWYSLNRLSPDYRIRTYWHSKAKIENGVLQGDLVWRGSGDPTLDHNALQEMMQQLQAAGVRHIQGQLVLDKSLWQSVPTAEAFHDDSDAAFTVDPDTHMLDYHVVWLQFTNQEQERWKLFPQLAGVNVDDSQLRWNGQKNCGLLKNRVQSQWLGSTILLKGSINAACTDQTMYSKGVVGDEFVYRAFSGLWRGMGGMGADSYRVSTTPIAAGRILAKHQSEPVAKVVETMNKYSNNVIARSLVMLSDTGNKVEATQALQQLQQQMNSDGINDGQLVLENGSGLSRRERVSARMMGSLLNKAYHSPYREPFWNSLPIAGVDGTLRKRFKPLTGRLHLKTGTLDNVHALAGYGVDDAGQTLAIVVMVNGKDTPQTLTQMDNVVTKIMAMPH
ncbi:D-alanyl-D-alanine carboxypeptidase/D-alanyl-D-alanine-endopeptidase [Vitreoscilla massiliensis]|uniref:D-alanyl-D-alanine carboxypeptidase/D-alanyl-D-alanine-endopeptidase n=1 Tax=Vitreoscilla massiliensis TaxID=1689272 RepID=A0ABY4DZ69_9NEIS|nr:D-alanyl-D-alanine carboxypeptidase/D-alanyl-D-alanine-endopeptidase [Vitreoscilla massiliensis]UOO88378.1 D-alanyl-D-alanine carboxypeptidase/D-alanyl-D-alanine-endopeptidase [Vitreoscilla massiliensis]